MRSGTLMGKNNSSAGCRFQLSKCCTQLRPKQIIPMKMLEFKIRKKSSEYCPIRKQVLYEREKVWNGKENDDMKNMRR